MMQGGVQLPDDVVLTGYQRSKTNRFNFDAIYESASTGFKGTEEQFITRGLAYRFTQIDKYTRRAI